MASDGFAGKKECFVKGFSFVKFYGIVRTENRPKRGVMMKKMISLILVLVLCVMLPISAAAASDTGLEVAAQTGDTLDLGVWFSVMGAALLLLVIVVALHHRFGGNK